MKKQNLKNLRLNKRSVSRLDVETGKKVKGGTGGNTSVRGCLVACEEGGGGLTNDPARPACQSFDTRCGGLPC